MCARRETRQPWDTSALLLSGYLGKAQCCPTTYTYSKGKDIPVTWHERNHGGWRHSCAQPEPQQQMKVGGQSHVSAALSPGRIPGTHCTRGCMGPRVGLTECGQEKIFFLHQDSNPESSRKSLFRRCCSVPACLEYQSLLYG